MTVTFFRGHPSDRLLPHKEILEASIAVLSAEHRPGDDDDSTRHPLTYGSDQGAATVREEIAKWTNRESRSSAEIPAECINLTNGASFGAATALTRCCPREYTKKAVAVSPTYYLINQIFIDAGFAGRTAAIVETESGLDLNGLESMLAEAPQLPRESPLLFRYILYLVPVFSNPGGYTITETEGRRLLDIARKYNVLLLCDQVYDYLQYDPSDPAPVSLVRLDRSTLPAASLGNVIANCSFSKYLGPGLRVGWQECATPQLAHHLSQTGANKSGGSPSHLNTFIVAEMLRSGAIDAVLSRFRAEYGKRSRHYLRAMEKHLPKGTIISGGRGGYFFWLIFPATYDVPAITAECHARGIVLAPGQHFEVNGAEKGWGRHCFRVSVSYHDADQAEPAIRIWGEVAAHHGSHA